MVQYVKQKHEILTPINEEMLKLIERAGRVCYKSEDKITDDSYKQFVKMIVERKHYSVIEHVSATVWFQTDRGVTHEFVRHRLASYSQESTRYCNYGKGKFGSEITVIDKKGYFIERNEDDDIVPDDDKPNTFDYHAWKLSIEESEKRYLHLVNNGVPPQIARGVLPNDLKTEIVVTANLREWGHIFKLRTSEAAHPCIRELLLPVLAEFREKIPCIYDDLSGF